MRGSHGLPPSLLGPIGKRFRRQTVPHMSTPEACPTRIRKGLRLVAPLAPFPKAQDRRTNMSTIITRSVMATILALRQLLIPSILTVKVASNSSSLARRPERSTLTR